MLYGSIRLFSPCFDDFGSHRSSDKERTLTDRFMKSKVQWLLWLAEAAVPPCFHYFTVCQLLVCNQVCQIHYTPELCFCSTPLMQLEFLVAGIIEPLVFSVYSFLENLLMQKKKKRQLWSSQLVFPIASTTRRRNWLKHWAQNVIVKRKYFQ